MVPKLRMRLLDTFAAALPNAREQYLEQLLRAHRDEKGPAGVWGRTERFHPVRAAFLNGTLAHGSDYDDTQGESGLHGSGVVAAAALTCAATLGSSGDNFMAAFAVGLETAVRIAGAVDQEINQRGFHTTSIVGIFGATAACSRLLGLSQRSIEDAFGLSGSLASGLRQFLIGGGDVKRIHGGWAAHGGYQAALWAAAGITGPSSILEGPYGFYRALLGRDVDSERVLAGLGSEWRAAGVMAKRYPCCHYLHAMIDAALIARNGLDPSEVERAVALIPKQGIGVVCEPDDIKRHPIEPYAAKFSAQYVLASALIDGAVGPQTFTRSAVARADVRAFTDRVRCRVHEFRSTGPFTYPGGVELICEDGRSLRQELCAPRAMDRVAIEHKLTTCAGFAGFDHAQIVTAVDGAHSARKLVAALTREAEELVQAPRRAGLKERTR